MSPDEIHFLLVLYLIYISDCFALPRSSGFMVYSPMNGWPRRVKSTETAAVFGRRYWMLRPWLPPLGASHRLTFPSCSFGKTGFCTVSPISDFAGMNGAVRSVNYAEIETVEVEDDGFFINRELWFKGAPGDLRSLRECLKSVAGADDHSAALHQLLLSRCDQGKNAKVRIKAMEASAALLAFFCSLYALWLLLFLPAVLFRLTSLLLTWGIGALVLHFACGFLFLYAHWKLLPEARSQKWETFIKMVLCPPMMIRACDPLMDHAGVPGDPVMALISCVREPVWRPLVQRVWRQLVAGRTLCSDPVAASIAAEYTEVYRSVLENVFAEQGIDPCSFNVDVSGLEPGQCRCPCCASVYRSDAEVCRDCGNVPLLNGRSR